MAAFLEKSTGSEGFHQVIDFLSQSHISYALTKKPEIYISFIKQFWRTAEASTDTNRRLTKGYTGVEIRLFPTMLTSPTPESSPIPSRITSSPSLSSEPSTEATFEPQPSLDAEYHLPTPNESPLHAVHSHGSDEGSLKLIELMNLVTKLSERIGVLEDDLKRTKQTYSTAFTKLILRIKKLESKVKTRKARKRARVMLSLEFYDKHNMAAFLEKSIGSKGFHQVIEFLSQSHISYTLTKKPEIYISFIKQFWRTAEASTDTEGRHQELTSPEQTATGKDFSNPLIVDSLLKTIWLSMHHVFTMKHWLVQSKRLLRTAEASTDTDGEVTITAIIDGQSKTITEASLRRHLKLEDHDGITSIPNSEIFEQLALIGYQTDSDKLTFQKGVFSP
ncbi:hypothetical protein Tco_0262427 [Tanacetum coccineum]